MKEQDSAHSFTELIELKEELERTRLLLQNCNGDIIRADRELTSLRSELQQERELRKEIIKASNELLRYDSSMKYAMTKKLQYSGRFIESLEAFSEVIEKAKLNN